MTQRLVENTLHTLAHFRLYRLRHRLFFQTMELHLYLMQLELISDHSRSQWCKIYILRGQMI